MKEIILFFLLLATVGLTSCDQTGPGCYKYDITYKGKTVIIYQYWEDTEEHDIFVLSLQSQGKTVISSKVNKNRTDCALTNVK